MLISSENKNGEQVFEVSIKRRRHICGELQQRRDQTGLVTNAVRVAREHERECRIRHEHPSVRSAWEQYQIMLSMVDTGS